MKLITYSLFNAGADPFEMRAYVRGFYFNCKMNALIYPDFRTHLEVDQVTYTDYQGLFDWLVGNMNLSLHVNILSGEFKQQMVGVPLCEGMLWRMKPIFMPDVSHILCRDADAITTYREALAVQEWLESGKKCHAVNDNRAHGGLMGGMVGFDCGWFKACMEASSWEGMIGDWDLTQRGSDQHWLNKKVLFRIKDSLYFSGSYTSGIPVPDAYSQSPLPQVDPKLWESNLIASFIGAPGFNELEALRFFKRFDKEPSKYNAIENEYPKLFHWRA